MRSPRIRYHVNVRAALALTAIVLASALCLYFLWGYQEKRVLRVAMTQVKAFQEAGSKEKDPEQRARANDLALRHLSQYLGSRPDDPQGLEIEAKLLCAGGDLGGAASFYEHLLRELQTGGLNMGMLRGAASVYEHLLRVEPTGARAQEARRRVASIYIILSDDLRYSLSARIMPEEAARELRYHAAELRADQLLAPDAKPPADDAEAHRLRAMALEGQIIRTNKDYRKVAVVVAGRKQEEKTLEEAAILEYQNALTREPGDRVAALRLAALYGNARDTAAARRVLEGLLKAHPDSVAVRLDRYKFFVAIGDPQAATAELEAALEKAPENLTIILTAVEDALQSGARDKARDWLEKVPEPLRDEPVVLLMRGMIEYIEQNYEAAIGTWRKGLEHGKGSDTTLTQRLAFLLLELGRDAEAAELVGQYRRLVSDEDPILRFLEALQDERAARYSRAIERLESVRNRLPEGYKEPVSLTMARCLEKQGEWAEAEKTYRAALQLKPKSAALRQSLARLLLLNKRPEEAAQELEKGLESNPNRPALLLSLTEARLQEQKARRAERRNWADFDAAYRRAAAAAPQYAGLILLHAERLASDGQLDQAISSLKGAVEKSPHRPEFAIRLAEYLLGEGEAAQALQVLTKASDPAAAGDRAALRIQRALVMATLGQGREARALLVQDVDKLPVAEQDEVWRYLVLLCRSQGDKDTTRAAYNEWARLLPDDSRPKFALLELELEAGDQKAILARLESLRPRGDREDGQYAWRLAQARVMLWKRSRTDTKQTEKERTALLKEADTVVESVLHDIKIDPAALLLKGQILEAEGAAEKAIDPYSQAWERGNAEALLRLVDLLVRLKRKPELERLRQSDATRQLDPIVASLSLRYGDREEASRIVQQTLNERPGRQAWQVAMLSTLGEEQKAESTLRAMAEQTDKLENWLALLRFQASHGRTRDAVEIIPEIRRRLKVEWPELLEAECRWAAADWPAADQAFDAALKRHPEVNDVQLVAARYFEERGRHDAAEECLRRILARNPTDRSALRQLAVVIAGHTDRPGAWKQALELLGPEGATTGAPEERLTRAIVLGQSGDRTRVQQSIGLLQALVADLPAENNVAATARDMLVRFLIATGQADQASKVAAVSATRGTNANAIALYAEALLQNKQFDAAEGQQKRLEKLDPGNAYATNLRARVILGRAKPGEAAAALEQAYLASEDSAGAEAFGREAFALILGMGPDAGAVAERLGRRLAGHNPALSWMPALVLTRRGNRDDALTLCRTAVEAGKVPADLREACRVTLEVAVASRTETSALKKADEVLDAAVRRLTEADDPLVMKAMISHLQGRFDEEVRLYRLVLKHQPRNTLVLNNLAYALSEGLDQPSAALAKIDELLSLGHRGAEFLDTRGVILMRMGQLDKAIKDLEEAVRYEPSGPHFYHLARAYQRAGRADEFRKALEQAQQHGLTPATIDQHERAEFEKLLNL